MTRQHIGEGDSMTTPRFRFERRTQHTIRISGRSTGYSIDRIHVYDSLCANSSDINNRRVVSPPPGLALSSFLHTHLSGPVSVVLVLPNRMSTEKFGLHFPSPPLSTGAGTRY